MATTQEPIGRAFLTQAGKRLTHSVERIKHCVNQLSNEQVWWRPQPELNSIGNILLHLSGNLRQWIVAGVGGAPDVRNRPAEFAERGPIPTAELLARFEAVVAEAGAILASFDPARLLEPRRIQGFDETVLSALFDTLAHLSGHTQEIIYITRLQLGSGYRFAWKPATPEQGAG